MKEYQPTIESIKRYIRDLQESIDIGAGNVAKLEIIAKDDFREAVEKTDYWSYVQKADYHYFVSRILFLHKLFSYSHFCSHQCIENYLKAYLKLKKQTPPNCHALLKILERIKTIAPESDKFIYSNEMALILKMYAPFYEFARYPVHHQRPKNGHYIDFFPDNIYVLDYFVMRMRELLTVPNRDILKNGHKDLYLCQRSFPNFYSLFYENNINFQVE